MLTAEPAVLAVAPAPDTEIDPRGVYPGTRVLELVDAAERRGEARGARRARDAEYAAARRLFERRLATVRAEHDAEIERLKAAHATERAELIRDVAAATVRLATGGR